MRKISEQLLIDISKTLNDASDAINNLEKMNKNNILYPTLKKRVQDMAIKLEDQYGLREYNDELARDKMLEKAKKDAER